MSAAQQPRFRVAVGGIMHESNSFNPALTNLTDFRVKDAQQDPELLSEWRKLNSELSGFVLGAEKAGIELQPVLFANATPKGPVSRDAFENLTGRFLERLQSLGTLDGLLLALHGAMVSEEYPHADEEIVRRTRKAFGPAFPIVVTHDFHANISPEIVDLSTVLIAYKQNPHLDTRERGLQAVQLMGRILRNEVKPVQVVVKPPMVYNIIFQNTYAEPLMHVTKESISLEGNPRILAASVSGGYQYADVPHMGPAVTVCADGDRALAEREATRLSNMLWETREQIRLQLPDPAEAVKQAMAADRFPVALFDTGDNIGGGSAGDSTFLLHELILQKATGWVMVITDPAAVQTAISTGINGKFDMDVGGKTDSDHGSPVRIRGRVRSLHNGEFIEPEVRHGGARYHELGVSAVIEVEGSTRDLQNLLLLTTRRFGPYTLHQLISCGIYPERQRILVVKGTIAPRAAYEPVAAKIILVDSPGATAVNPARYEFKRVPQDLFGLR